ncbi:hypothetical protein CC80DRAFT_416790 [Byssothecium circinans]|uniref:Lytic polysaccharide monooxygenase n=1 Tax=Byssothecium circinans TaxID=147558 RepID=A0A6A5TR02_9PLEO|nr:hypothetical protein CC80DRAFT_416790 [Byssothecium circinans]
MHLNWPPALKGDNNPHTAQADPFLNYPYGCCGKPVAGNCHGHAGLIDTDEGKPVVTWAPGQTVNFTLSGQKLNSPTENPAGGTHYGGSCQVGFSTDKGKTFKVATTWQGNCPDRKGNTDPSTQLFKFTVPADTPAGERVLFGWTWINREKEFNMNCASVTISGTNTSPEEPAASSSTPNKPSSTPAASAPSSKPSAPASAPRAEAVSFASRPDMLLGIDFAGAKCHSKGGSVELEFPDPGPNVVKGDGEYKLAPPTC